MANSTSDMPFPPMEGSMHEEMAKTAVKGGGGAKGPRQDPRQPGGTSQKSNPHLHKATGMINHKAGKK